MIDYSELALFYNDFRVGTLGIRTRFNLQGLSLKLFRKL